MRHHKFNYFGPDSAADDPDYLRDPGGPDGVDGPGEGSLVRGPTCQGLLGLV